jgi:hypothetical protein
MPAALSADPAAVWILFLVFLRGHTCGARISAASQSLAVDLFTAFWLSSALGHLQLATQIAPVVFAFRQHTGGVRCRRDLVKRQWCGGYREQL